MVVFQSRILVFGGGLKTMPLYLLTKGCVNEK